MAVKKQVPVSELKVGLLVSLALLIMAALILQQSWGLAWFGDSVKALTYLPDVGGLKPGAPVWLAGIEIGRVRRVSIIPPENFAGNEPVLRDIASIKKDLDSIDPKQPTFAKMTANLLENLRSAKDRLRLVEVQLDIGRQYLDRVSRDSEVAIQSRGLIGDSFLQLSPGTYSVTPLKKGEFFLIEGVRTTGFREIMTGANDVVANFGVLSEQVKNIAFRINPDRVGAGLIDTLAQVQHTLKSVDSTFTEASQLVQEMRTGPGTMGRLVSDPELYKKLTAALDNFNTTVDQMRRGSGSLAKLINDPALYDHASATLKKAEVMMDRIEKGEGTLGKLSRDDALYSSSRRAVDRFASLVEQIDKGEGTMGKLVRDPSLYNNLNQSTAEAAKFIYDLRRDPKKYLTIRVRLF